MRSAVFDLYFAKPVPITNTHSFLGQAINRSTENTPSLHRWGRVVWLHDIERDAVVVTVDALSDFQWGL